MRSFVALIPLLGIVWWLALRALDWATTVPYRGLSVHSRPGALVGEAGLVSFPGATLEALERNDLPQLDCLYESFRETDAAIRPVGAASAPAALFEEALVSLALAEARNDLAKAYRGLAAVQRLRFDEGDSMAANCSAAADVVEGRLRLVLAEAGSDPRQRALATLALERAEAYATAPTAARQP